MSELATNVRVKAEGVAILSRTSVTFFVLVYDSRSPRWNGELALLAFALGQLAYGISLLGTYMRHYGRMTFFLRPIDSPDARYVGCSARELTLIRTKRSFLGLF